MMVYKVPYKVKMAVKEGLELRSEYGRGGTSVGLAMAEKLYRNQFVSYDTVKKVSQYFARHEKDRLDLDGKDGREVSNGYIAWMLWGGYDGWDWSKKIVDQMEE